MNCKKCKMEIPNGAKICPYCRSKQGGNPALTVILVVVCIIVILFSINVVGSIIKGYNAAVSERANSSQSALSREEYIEGCSEIAFSDLERNPDKYIGEPYKFTGKVIEVVERGTTIYLRVNVTKGEYLWRDTIFAELELPRSADRILEDDIITMYGDCMGLYTYESITGAQVSLPSLKIRYFELNSDE